MAGIYIICVVFTCFNARFYHTPLAKISSVTEKETMSRKGTRDAEEYYYTQKITARILNGTHKGEEISISNEYTSSQVQNQKYHKGDTVLLSGSRENPGKSIRSIKRDGYLALLAGGLFFLLICITGKQGFYTIISLILNTIIFAFGFQAFMKGENILNICNVIAFLFSITTLICLNGIHRKTWASVISTICVLFLIMALFEFSIQFFGDLDYSNLEYLGSMSNSADIFWTDIMLTGLGAIMDVAVTISAATGEIVRKNPDVSLRKLIHSGREIGYDIMGTMINVLLFVLASGMIPMFILKMNNEIRFITIIRYHETTISEKERQKMIIFLALVLIILMILIGGERGAVSLMTLAGNIVILFISILLMSIGFPALLLILAAGAGVCYNSLFYQNGNNPKTRAAFLATLLVMLLLFIPIYLIIWRSGSYGLNELQLSEDDFMYYYSTDIHINMLHVAVFVTVFSTLGAVIDTALSVTSSVYEVWTHKNSLTAKELTSSGYQVGKEIIGTTVNTLLFAYLGGSILLFAYVQTQQYNLEIILNSKFLFQDVAIMLSGAIACLFTVPVSIRCVIRQIHHAASETDHS